MLLILLRHAQAVAVGEEGVTADVDRHLTEKGHTQAKAVAEHLTEKGVKPDAILSSPFRRAVETAEPLKALLADEAGFVLSDDFASESGRIESMAVAAAETGEETVVCVGHMPDIAAFARWLTGMGIGAFATAQAVAIRFPNGIDEGEGRVEWTFVPG